MLKQTTTHLKKTTEQIIKTTKHLDKAVKPYDKTLKYIFKTARKYLIPKEHRKLRKGFYHITYEIENNIGQSIERISKLEERINEKKTEYNRGVWIGRGSAFTGAAVFLLDNWFNLGVSQYTKHIPEYVSFVWGMVHTTKNGILFLDTEYYQEKIDGIKKGRTSNGVLE